MADVERSTRTVANPVRIVGDDGLSPSISEGSDSIGEERVAVQTQDIRLDDIWDELRQTNYRLSLMLAELQRLTFALSDLNGEDYTAAIPAAQLEE